jgi:hypothetical protein
MHLSYYNSSKQASEQAEMSLEAKTRNTKNSVELKPLSFFFFSSPRLALL